MHTLWKPVVLIAALLSSSAFAQDAFYKEHCENNMTATNLKTGETASGDQTKMTTGSDNIEWTDGNKDYRLTLEDTVLPDGTFPMIQQNLRTTVPGSQPDQTINNISAKDFKLLDYKVTTHTLTSQILVTVKSPTESTATDIGKDDSPKLPDESIVTVAGTLGATTSTHTQLQPYISGDYRIDSSVTVCTDTPVQAKDMSYQGFYAGVKTPIATFTKQHAATMTAKKALTDCQAKPDPKDCSAFDKKYQASAKNRDSVWASLINANHLPVPKRPPSDNGGGSTVEVPNNNCDWNSECPNNEACLNHICQRGECSQRSDCPFYQSCVNGSCESNNGTGCNSSSDCIGSEQCVRGICTSDSSTGGCRSDSDCENGMTCNSQNICSN